MDTREGEGDFQMEDSLPVDFHTEDSHFADSLAGGNTLPVADSQVEEDNLAGEDIQLVPAYKLAFAVQQRCR